MPRPEQMNINVATWGRLLKKNINMSKSVVQENRDNENSGRKIHQSNISDPLVNWT